MKKVLLFIYIVIYINTTNSQCITDYTWECEQWKECLAEGADSTGMHIHYYKNGTIKHKGMFINGIPSGTWLFYDEMERKFAESNYNGDFYFKAPHELYTFQMIILGHYRNGQRSGDWYYFSIDSILIMKENYDNELVYTYEAGNIKGLYKFNKKERLFQLHNQGGNFVSIGEIGFLQKGNLLLSSFFSVHGNSFNKYIREYKICLYNPFPILLDSIHYKPIGLNITYSFGRDLIKYNNVDFSPVWGLGFETIKLVNKDLNIKTYRNFSLLLDFAIDSKFNFLFKDSYFDDNGISIGARVGTTFHIVSLNKIFNVNNTNNVLNWYYPYIQITLSWYNKRGF